MKSTLLNVNLSNSTNASERAPFLDLESPFEDPMVDGTLMDLPGCNPRNSR